MMDSLVKKSIRDPTVVVVVVGAGLQYFMMNHGGLVEQFDKSSHGTFQLDVVCV